MPKLLDAVTSDTVGTAEELIMGRRGRVNQLHSVYVFSGDFGGGTVTIQVSPDNGTSWFTARTDTGAQAAYTQSDVFTVFLQGSQIRAELAGSTNPTALTVILY